MQKQALRIIYVLQIGAFGVSRRGPKMILKSSFGCSRVRFLSFWDVLDDPVGAILVQIVVKKCVSEKECKMVRKRPRYELGPGSSGSLKQEN